MSPEQLNSLQKLTELFEQGQANVHQIKELSDLIRNISIDPPVNSLNPHSQSEVNHLNSIET